LCETVIVVEDPSPTLVENFRATTVVLIANWVPVRISPVPAV
jgi:hypothetical protein